MRLADTQVVTYGAPTVRPEARYPQPFDDRTLALAVGISWPALWYFVLNAHKFYHHRTIPKKSGGERVLHVPDAKLARAQRKVLRKIFNKVDYPAWVAAYVPGRSVVEAAEVHAGRGALIVLDIKDFFPSTRRAWVRDALQGELGLGRKASEILATLLTAPEVPGTRTRFILPQGAPTSGAVANLVAMHRLDPGVRAVCAEFGMDYTRYADDLAFSSMEPVSRETVNRFIRAIIRAIRRSQYHVNYDKIRVHRRDRQQRLLGLTINEHPNLPRPLYRKLRALVHHCVTRGFAQTAAEQGYESSGVLESYLYGYLSYAASVAPARAAKLQAQLRGCVPGSAPKQAQGGL